MTAHLSNTGSHWNQEDRFEPRDIAELHTVTDCVEEILFRVVHTMAMVPVLEDVKHIRSQRGALYDWVEAIVKRAQALPPEGGIGSQPQND